MRRRRRLPQTKTNHVDKTKYLLKCQITVILQCSFHPDFTAMKSHLIPQIPRIETTDTRPKCCSEDARTCDTLNLKYFCPQAGDGALDFSADPSGQGERRSQRNTVTGFVYFPCEISQAPLLAQKQTV